MVKNVVIVVLSLSFVISLIILSGNSRTLREIQRETLKAQQSALIHADRVGIAGKCLCPPTKRLDLLTRCRDGYCRTMILEREDHENN